MGMLRESDASRCHMPRWTGLAGTRLAAAAAAAAAVAVAEVQAEEVKAEAEAVTAEDRPPAHQVPMEADSAVAAGVAGAAAGAGAAVGAEAAATDQDRSLQRS